MVGVRLHRHLHGLNASPCDNLMNLNSSPGANLMNLPPRRLLTALAGGLHDPGVVATGHWLRQGIRRLRVRRPRHRLRSALPQRSASCAPPAPSALCISPWISPSCVALANNCSRTLVAPPCAASRACECDSAFPSRFVYKSMYVFQDS